MFFIVWYSSPAEGWALGHKTISVSDGFVRYNWKIIILIAAKWHPWPYWLIEMLIWGIHKPCCLQGSFSLCCFSLSVMLYCMSRAGSWSWSSLSLSVAPEDFLVSVGVIIFSYTSQIFLPPLEGSMADRGQFNAMLGWTHGAACIMKTAFSLLVSESIFLLWRSLFLLFHVTSSHVSLNFINSFKKKKRLIKRWKKKQINGVIHWLVMAFSIRLCWPGGLALVRLLQRTCPLTSDLLSTGAC